IKSNLNVLGQEAGLPWFTEARFFPTSWDTAHRRFHFAPPSRPPHVNLHYRRISVLTHWLVGRPSWLSRATGILARGRPNRVDTDRRGRLSELDRQGCLTYCLALAHEHRAGKIPGGSTRRPGHEIC